LASMAMQGNVAVDRSECGFCRGKAVELYKENITRITYINNG
jgi:hypothetical protein